MTFDKKKYKGQLLFLPLGGSGEIGMNLNLYYLDGKWLMVDLGAGFADDYYPGVDMIVPEINFIIENKEDLLGLVVTHAHEDHLGAVQYLWQELECPIYTTPFTASFLKAKLQESSFASRVPIHELPISSKFDLGPFSIEMVPLTHSAPEMQALMIRTRLGNIFHTGDWKLDHDPLVGEVNDEKRLKALGKEGVLALVGDSTNVFNETMSGSEGELRKSLFKLIGECKKMVVVTTFASNVARLDTLMMAAKEHNRKVVLAGRSLFRILDAAQESGYLLDTPEIIDASDISNYAREDIMVIATGCQGEPLAAINKMVTGAHQYIKLRPEDAVIFSSKVIPGNEKKIFRLFNLFVHLGVEVYTEKDHFVHVSGHPSKAELKWMYDLIKPEVAVPVHGELVHMHEHVRLAKKWGTKQAIQIENGALLKLAPGKAEITEQVESGYLGVDGYSLLSASSQVMRMRRKLQRDGIVMVTLILDNNWYPKLRPIIKAPGLLDPQEDEGMIEAMADEVESAIDNHLSANPRKTGNEQIRNLARSAVRRILKSELGKNPVIDVHIEI